MALILPVSETFADGVMHTWTDMQQLPEEEPDIGESVLIAGFEYLMVQHSGPWLNVSRLTWDFSNDPMTVGWFTIAGIGSYYSISPGYKTHQKVRYARPKCIAGILVPVTISLYCSNKAPTL